jgi:1-phosphofructokinase family hexose kinase
MIVDAGPETDVRYVQQLFGRIRRHVRPGDWMVVAGSIPPPLPASLYRELVELGHSLGVRTVLDADAGALAAGVGARPTLVKANRRELGRLFKRDLFDEDSAVAALNELRAVGVQIAALTRGREGSVAIDGQGCWRALPPRIHQSTPVGAGDAFLAGMVKVLSEGGALSEALRLGTAAGAAAALSEGTQLARMSQIESFYPRVKLQRIGEYGQNGH